MTRRMKNLFRRLHLPANASVFFVSRFCRMFLSACAFMCACRIRCLEDQMLPEEIPYQWHGVAGYLACIERTEDRTFYTIFSSRIPAISSSTK